MKVAVEVYFSILYGRSLRRKVYKSNLSVSIFQKGGVLAELIDIAALKNKPDRNARKRDDDGLGQTGHSPWQWARNF